MRKLVEKKWFIILMLVMVFPFGLYLMWTRTDWSSKTKSIITAFVGLMVIVSFIVPTEEVEQSKEDTHTSTQSAHKSKEKKSSTNVSKKKEAPKKSVKKQKKKTNEQKIVDHFKKKENVSKAQYNADTKHLLIEYKDIDAFTEKGMKKNEQRNIAQSVIDIGKADLDLETIDINILATFEDSNLDEKVLPKVRTTWTYEFAKKTQSKHLGQLTENPGNYAENYERLR